MKRLLLSLASLALAGCATHDTVAPKKSAEQIVAHNLDTPWAIERSDNTFYITERPGHIVKVQHGDMK